jgi:hypothetical protein
MGCQRLWVEKSGVCAAKGGQYRFNTREYEICTFFEMRVRVKVKELMGKFKYAILIKQD